jgi:N-acetylglucosamine-6-phosphate deacetylase
VSKNALIAIDAGTLLTPTRKFAPGRVLIDGHSIVESGTTANISIPSGAERVDASQMLVMPGFIEPHIHGCGGVDVMDGTYESLNAVSRILARHGTTSFLATTVSAPLETLSVALEKLGALMARPFDGAQPLGIHLEGPFINADKRGTHKAANVLPPFLSLLSKWIGLAGNSLRLVTIAPELPGADALARFAKEAGVTVAMGHSNATFEEASSGIDLGICYAVHTFNAMRGLSHRDPGIIGAVLTDDRVFAEIIADGIHVDPAAVRLFARAKGRELVLLVTDAISAMDMPDGEYVLGTDTVNVVNGVCRDAEGRLAGSTLTQELALRNFARWTGWSVEDALPGLTLNPARALKLERKGMLESGADADVVIMDKSFRIMKTFVKGKLVYDRLWTN